MLPITRTIDGCKYSFKSAYLLKIVIYLSLFSLKTLKIAGSSPLQGG
jgi:hypothetical protein